MRAGVLQLSRWGLLDRVVAAGTPPIRRTAFHYADGEHVAGHDPPEPGVDALYAPRRHVLDRILVDAAAEAGADVLHETTVTGAAAGRDGRVRGVSARGADGARLELPADSPSARTASGRVVAEQAGCAGRCGRAARERGALPLLRGLPADGYEWAYGDGAAAGLHPHQRRATCVFVATTPPRMRPCAGPGRSGLRPPARRGRRRRWPSGSATRDRSAGSRAGRGPRLRPPVVGPGWALVGDAGYFKDPITTHGITDALRDAELLADAILDAQAAVPRRSRWRATRTPGTDSRGSCSRSPRRSRRTTGTPRVRALLRGVSSAMSDEVDHLQALSAAAAAT